MTTFLQNAVSGLATGTTYAVIALGFALVFGVLRVLNTAHGDIVGLGAYAGIFGGTVLSHGDVWMALGCAVVVCAVTGFLLERIAIRPVAKSELAPFLTTLGAAFVIQAVIRFVFSSSTYAYPIHLPNGAVHIGLVAVAQAHLYFIAASVAALVVMEIVVFHTQFGRQMRAVAEDSAMAMSLGIRSGMIRSGTIIVASALGGATGVMLGYLYSAVTPSLGLGLTVKALAIVIVGGLS